MDVKIVCFSDTHCQHREVKLPECDIAIFAGDLSGTGQRREVEEFLNWYSHQVQCTERIWIAGNHDRSFDPKFREAFKLDDDDWVERYKCWPGLIYLEDSSIERFGLKIWGSPWTPWFHGDRWAFNKHRGDELRAVWREIPLDADIVVTHGPIFGKLDYTLRDKSFVGCEDLRHYIEAVDPKLHVCGHIHEGYGMDSWGPQTVFVNAAFCDAYNTPKNDPIEVTLTV